MRDPFDPDARVIDEPIVVFEILSPGTAQVDRVVKAREYWAAPSIEHYVMLEQDHPGAVLLSRGARDWQRHVVGQDQALALPAIGVRLDLAELYRRLAPAARTPSQG
jgi:Uma2 family endonuclease